MKADFDRTLDKAAAQNCIASIAYPFNFFKKKFPSPLQDTPTSAVFNLRPYISKKFTYHIKSLPISSQ